MKLATIADGTRDGRLVVVTKALDRAVEATAVRTLQAAIEDWGRVLPDLQAQADRLDAGDEPNSFAFDATAALAPLPRAWQWLDASAFASHGELLQQAYGLPAVPVDPPLMYQGLSHQFLPGHADVAFPGDIDGIDFEAEYAVIVDDVPMGTAADAALGHVKLIMLLNDWSLRTLGAAEMRTGFGWIQAKPACSAAPVAVTPDELGDAWRDGRVHLAVHVDYNGARFGAANGGAMGFGFHELIAHAARTRMLCAGTIIGSGTVSNPDYRIVGSSCIAERRAIEMVDDGAPRTPFMRPGDGVRIEVLLPSGSAFGAIDQHVTA